MSWLDGITNSMDMSLSKLRDSKGQGSLACCSPWGREESDVTEQLNDNDGRLGCQAGAQTYQCIRERMRREERHPVGVDSYSGKLCCKWAEIWTCSQMNAQNQGVFS